MAARGLFMDDDPEQARRLAWQHIESFRAQKAQLWGKGQGPMAKLSPDELLQRMLVGTPQDIVGQVLALHRAGVTRLALNPLTSSPEQRLKQFEWFVLAVWPQVQAALNADLSARHST
jgi:alkanesulfonate monooxygenase SsuD/methylene tetrahydromethanopterin reductase-like flavin-dependent oxidoreductase (luciferase family)